MGETKESSGFWIPIEKIKMHPDNPKIHTDEQIGRIAESIKGNGWGRPIELSTDNYILAGHGTYLAAMKLKYKKVKVDYLDPPRTHDEPEAISYMLADNRFSEMADWNYGKLDMVIGELEDVNFNVGLTGFEPKELKIPTFDKSVNTPEKSNNDNKNDTDPEDDWDGMPEFKNEDKEGRKIIVHFANEEDVQDFAELVGQKINEKTKYIWYPKVERLSVKSHVYVPGDGEDGG